MTRFAPRVVMLYGRPWQKELTERAAGNLPSHRTYYADDLRDLGYDVRTPKYPRSLDRWLRQHLLAWRLYCTIASVLMTLRKNALVLATSESTGAPLLALRRLGWPVPVVIFNVAILKDANRAGRRHRIWRWLLRGADAVISFASSQVDQLAQEFDMRSERSVFVPLGVDSEFITSRIQRRESSAQSGAELGVAADIVSLGTNEGRDYPTLVEAFHDPLVRDLHGLIVCDDITRRRLDDIAHWPKNLTLHRTDLPYESVLQVYASARVGVVPLRDIAFSSGQTVILEMMAAGLPIITIAGPSTSDYLENDVSAVLIDASDAPALAAQMRRLSDAPALQSSLAAAAKGRVDRNFTSATTGAAIARALEPLLPHPPQ